MVKEFELRIWYWDFHPKF